MVEKGRKALWGLAGVIALAAVGAVPFIGKPQPPTNWTDLGDAWATFVYNYQTLITGGLAVCAAWFTVQQMRKDDAAAERRHDHATRLSLRADALCVSRAFNPQYYELDQALEGFRSVVAQIARVAPKEVLSTQYLQAARPALVRHFDNISFLSDICLEAIERPQFADAARLFSGQLSRDIEVTKGHIKRQAEKYVLDGVPLAEILEHNFDADRVFVIERWLDRNDKAVAFFMIAMTVQLPKILEGLRVLDTQYSRYLPV